MGSNNKYRDHLEEILIQDYRFRDENDEIDGRAVKIYAQKLDEKLIGYLVEDDKSREKFFLKINDAYVFKANDFNFFLEQNKLNNSFTKYANQIGLTLDGKYLKDTSDVVLDFPYKDCVLKGGQSTEEGKDTFFEFDEEVTKTQKKKGYDPNQYNEKQTAREEIFYNNIIAKDEIDRLEEPKAFENIVKYTEKGEENFEKFNRNDKGVITENLLIKGNNLLALHSLKEEFKGKVKLIYLDPPYNTGKDTFNYNDKFNHSTWLTFIRNRIAIARELLAEDGVLIVQSDDKEQAYLKVLLDEIMGREQFETSFYIQVRYSNKTLSEDNDFQKVMEIAHVYSKKHSSFTPNKIKEDYSLEKFCYEINKLKKGKKIEVGGKQVEIFKEGEYEIKKVKPHIDGLKETWATGSLIRQGGTAAEFLSKYLIKRKKEDGLKVLYKIQGMGEDGLGFRYVTGPKKKTAKRGKFYSGVPSSIKDGVISGEYNKELPIPNLLYNYLQYEGDFGNCRHEGGVDIGGGKKPEALIKYFIEYFTNEGDVVIDMFSGSGTTAAVAHKMNRTYIVGEQLEDHLNTTFERLTNVINGDNTGISKYVEWQGGGSFVYLEMAKNNEKAKKAIEQCDSLEELTRLFDELYEKYFLHYNVKIKEFKERIIKEEQFKNLSLDQQKEMFCRMLDNNQMYVNCDEMEDAHYDLTDKDIALTKDFYQIEE